MYLGAFWLFILAESIIFLTLFSTRLLLVGLDRSPRLNVPLGIALTAILLVSLLPAARAVRAISQGDMRTMSLLFLVTAALGLLAIVAILYDWVTVSLAPGSRFGEIYFVTEGYHLAHLIIGVLAFAGLWANGIQGRFHPENYWAVQAGVRFWYFVVAAWVALFVVFFVL